MKAPCNTENAAEMVGISVMTLHRWMVAAKVKAPKLRIRNGRAVRLWTKTDLAQLRKVKQETYCKGRGRKKGYKASKTK
jgi:predicted site-specific integrase-resolvase